MIIQCLPALPCDNVLLCLDILFTIIHFLVSKCITLIILYCTCIEFITYAMHIVKVCWMHFKVDTNLHSYYIMLEYHGNRLTAQNYLI